MSNYYTKRELKKLGLNSYGENVLISKKASIYSPEKITLGNNVRIDDFCILSGNISIGNYVHIAPFCGLFGRFGIEIGDYSTTSSKVMIYSNSDDYSGESLVNPMIPGKYKNLETGKVIIEKHFIIGSGSVILPGVNIETGVAVGALSLVKKDLSSWGIYSGVPVKKIKDRKKDLLELQKKMESDLK
ncbi:galactoside O-acetyltransferase [Halanaerobium saccharolyticum]|jgi:galactoside O-acetyltransferase|uniref:Chloramphenicol acetyltransferase n=1 Tax=Halanaerobium saccharolyticum TaxID=43595 RepID=A0A2T5RHU0_9FIRM|nr:galactoside O-acetyltransferase [Halanaerobium saccharolyticum]PTV96833.1 galactoside O-acetyltransferase [Halanaerobium saccharolyticum]